MLSMMFLVGGLPIDTAADLTSSTGWWISWKDSPFPH
jgi:hypothetical protein